jgi:membrane protein implicated in regulation of membrane protease activity
MDWWIWLILGCALLLLEMATPGGFYFIFFGSSAFVVGILDLLGLAKTPWMEWILFSAFAAASTAIFRKRLLQRWGATIPTGEVDTLVGEVATVIDGISAGGVGRAELRGTAWSARNTGNQALSRGQRCLVERVDGLTIFIRAEASGSSSH